MLAIKTDKAPQSLDIFAFRHDIQALRGMAVLVVVLQHLKVPGFDYGYLGVDVFFVISGFVISGLVKRQTLQNSWSLINFFQRRIWRLLPTLYAVLALILVFTFISPASYRIQIFESIPYAATGLSNFFFYLQTDYFSSASILKPVLHTWSLSVEEQFYFIFTPLIAFFISKKTLIQYLFLTFFLVLLLSFIIDSDKNARFYLLPSRALELLTGVAAFIFINHQGISFSRIKNLINLISSFTLVSIIPAFELIKPNQGIASVLITLVTAIFLVTPSLTNDILFKKNLPFIGLGAISYPFYLAHWPIISFAHINGFSLGYTLVKISLFIFSLMTAYFLHLHIEKRYYFNRKSDLIPVSVMLFCTVSLIIIPITAIYFIQKFETHISNINYRDYFKENYNERFRYGRAGSCFLTSRP